MCGSAAIADRSSSYLSRRVSTTVVGVRLTRKIYDPIQQVLCGCVDEDRRRVGSGSAEQCDVGAVDNSA